MPSPVGTKEMKMTTMNTAARIAAYSSITMISFLFAYLRRNTSGHTGVSPYWALLVFAPSLILGAANMIATRRYQVLLWR